LSVHHTGFGKQRYRAGFKKSGLKLKLWYDVFKMLIHVNYQIDGIYLFIYSAGWMEVLHRPHPARRPQVGVPYLIL
jgi:hypothetical protein